MLYQPPSEACTQGCSDKVTEGLLQDTMLLCDLDRSCLEDCEGDLALMIDVRCACNNGLLLSDSSTQTLLDEEYCCGGDECTAAILDYVDASSETSRLVFEKAISHTCATMSSLD